LFAVGVYILLVAFYLRKSWYGRKFPAMVQLFMVVTSKKAVIINQNNPLINNLGHTELKRGSLVEGAVRILYDLGLGGRMKDIGHRRCT